MKINLEIEVPGRYNLVDHIIELRNTARMLLAESDAIAAAAAASPHVSLRFDGYTWGADLTVSADGMMWDIDCNGDTPEEAIKLVESLAKDRARFCGVALSPDFTVPLWGLVGDFNGKAVHWIDQSQFAGDFDEDDLAAIEDFGIEVEELGDQKFRITRDRYAADKSTRPVVDHGRAA